MEFLLYYTLENELQYAEKVLSMKGWFRKNGYKISLPAGVDENSSQKELEDTVKNEFHQSREVFEKIKPEVEDILEKNSGNIQKFFGNFDYEKPSQVNIYFTVYGPGGSYGVPDNVVIMLKNDPVWIVKMIIHETIHLIIEEPFVQKYNISHWEKEYIVDSLCMDDLLKSIYTDYSRQKQTVKPD